METFFSTLDVSAEARSLNCGWQHQNIKDTTCYKNEQPWPKLEGIQ